MKKFNKKNILLIFSICLILIISWIYKFYTVKNKSDDNVYKNNKGKTIVRVWIKEDADSNSRQYQAKKFNDENKDNIVIDLKTYKDDYYNVIKTALANDNALDIFQYGYSDLLRYKHVMNLAKMDIPSLNLQGDNVLLYNKEPIGIKATGNTVKMLVNKDILKKAGLPENYKLDTWDSILTACEKIKANCPGVVPFEFPASNYDDLRISVGEPSVNSDTVYTSFWNYESGKYDFDSSKNILKVYNKMYVENLIKKQFYKMDDFDIRSDFYEGKAAIVMSTYKDKSYFKEIMPLDFNVGISDIPQFGTSANKYYYIGDYDCFLINSNIKNKKDVKEVYTWLFNDSVDEELLSTNRVLPITSSNLKIQDKQYEEYNNTKNYYSEKYDPTIYIYYDRTATENSIYNGIKGIKTDDEVIKELNTNYESYCNITKQQVKFDFSKYINK